MTLLKNPRSRLGLFERSRLIAKLVKMGADETEMKALVKGQDGKKTRESLSEDLRYWLSGTRHDNRTPQPNSLAGRLYEKPSCRNTYGWTLPWEDLHPNVQAAIEDMQDKGDWKPRKRKRLKGAISANYPSGLKYRIKNKPKWMMFKKTKRRIALLDAMEA